MERFLLRIWIFVLAFGFGISISAIWRIYTLPALPESVIAPIGEPPVVSESPRVRKNGRLLCEVEASSLDHLAWFEERR